MHETTIFQKCNPFVSKTLDLNTPSLIVPSDHNSPIFTIPKYKQDSDNNRNSPNHKVDRFDSVVKMKNILQEDR